MTGVAGAILTMMTFPAEGQTLESVIMPGKVIEGHAKLESECKNCHVRFQRAAQSQLCLDCHKEVSVDVRSKSGYHGRLKEAECRSCHTEHKGRDAKIVALDEPRFDHSLTDFALLGKHIGTPCLGCHRAKAKHRAAPAECAGCHRKDDRHKGGLGAKCETCHSATDWKDTRFDHSRTRFPLLRRHAQVKCGDCHAEERYANTPRACVSCHRKNDTHKGHFGPRCETCHNEAEWKTPTFLHDRDTRFPLRDRHRLSKCESCHKTPLYREKAPTTCDGCHRNADVHRGALGDRCENCHSEKGWKGTRFEHDRETRFPLRDRHREVKCAGCHPATGFRGKAPSTCFGCHERDDREKAHKDRYGEKCGSCHTEKGWKILVFDHDRDTRYALRGTHRQVKCDVCHRGVLYRDKIEPRCVACHQGDDKHNGQLGPRCDSCHNERNWREASFDHNRSRFPLIESHVRVECKECHLTLAFKDAKTECLSCHAKADRHKERLGPRCEQCHNARSWKSWEFDHDQRTRFKLGGAHTKIACLACHTVPVKDKFDLASNCFSCHRKDDTHLGSFGQQCDRCHVTENWRRIINRERIP